MRKHFTIPTLRFILFSLFAICIFSTAKAQTAHDHGQTQPQLSKAELEEIAGKNSFGIPAKDWIQSINKTNLLLEGVDQKSFINYIILQQDGSFADFPYFANYVSGKFKKDREELVHKVGQGKIINVEQVKTYFSDLQPLYTIYYADFIQRRESIIATQDAMRAPSVGTPNPTPANCGSPCTNPGFEAGSTTFWDGSTGSACTSPDPCSIVAGFSSSQHVVTTVGSYDPTVGGTTLPQVPPGGGNNALMLGNGAMTGGNAARVSISFTVSAANANFTYRYAVVLQDPVSGHSDPERPYFRVKIRDASGNVVTCGDYEVIAKPPLVGFVSLGANVYYRPWTTVFVPLSSYIGQCITVEFTSSDCSQGGHYGYAYVDGDCDPLQLLSSSPSVCGGNTVTLTAPAGAATYTWTNTAGGTAGIVGSNNNQTCVVDAGGTYQCVMTSVSGPTCTTTLTITVGSSPSNPVAGYTNTTVCTGSPTVFTDTSTPVGSINSWAWDFNNDGTTDDATQNPSFTFAGAGTYPVTLTITWGA
ncbi:MAG: PKD domain-containing protein, partial [Bacteroidota bacterium]|nr:PKD domain-containing protein [Bacteroidota bacterium]